MNGKNQAIADRVGNFTKKYILLTQHANAIPIFLCRQIISILSILVKSF